MVATNLEVIIDGDGHIFEDLDGIAKRFPPGFLGGGASPGTILTKLFPPVDHLHAAQPLRILKDAFSRPGLEGWLAFADDVGIEAAVLYPSNGLASGQVVNRDWAISLCRAYNDWLHDTYTQNSRFRGMALIPMQEPAEAVLELRRSVEELGFCGAVLPTTGLPIPMGDKPYWPVYEEAHRLGCAIAFHGGAHGRLGMDHVSNYAAINALGHPFGISIAFASVLLNGVLDKYPNARFGFLEAGIGWLLMAYERLDRAYATHIPYDPRGELAQLLDGESFGEYMKRHTAEGRIFVGCEGDEPLLSAAIKEFGNGFPVFSSDFPHEVNSERCKDEIQALLENADLTDEDKNAIMSLNAQRFYGLSPVGA